jgi:fibronectin-binding autotransporter adhesin
MAGVSAQAVVTNWWDPNGTAAGAATNANGSASGTWSASGTNWTSSSAGTGVTTAWTPGAVAAFSAGNNATGSAITVTISGTQELNGILKEEGGSSRPFFSGGVLSFTGENPFIQGNMGFQGNCVIEGTNTLTIGGSGHFQNTTTVDALRDAAGGQLSIKIKDGNFWNWKYTNTSYSGGTLLDANSTIIWGANPNTSGDIKTNPDNGIGDSFGSGAITMESGSTFAGRLPTTSVSNSWRTVTNAFVLNGDVTIEAQAGTAPSNGFNSLTLSGPVTLTGDRKITVDAVANIGNYRSNTTEIAGAIGGNYKLTKGGQGLLVLSGDNTFSGGIAVEAGTLMAGKANTFNNNTLDFTSTLSSNKTVALNGFSQVVKGLTGEGTNGISKLANGLANNPSAAAAVLTVSNASASSFGGMIGGNNANERNLSLVKKDLGTLTLTGTNNYSGTTLVNAGTLVINGDNSGATNTLTIDAGATLMGSGIIGGATTVNGMLKPGNSPGTLTFDASLTLGATSETTFEIASASSFDVLTGNSSNVITFDSGADIIFDFTGNTTVSNGSSFAVLQNWNSVVTNGAVFSVVGLTNPDLSVDYSKLVSDGIITVIPEPVTVGMLGLGALLTIMFRRIRTA